MVQRKSVSYRVGLLTIGVLATFFALLLLAVGVSWDAEESRYEILFDENVKGMVVGSKVNFQGVPVGAVHDIAFRDGFTHVVITVDSRKAAIQRVTQARLDRLLVTGQVTIELEGYARGVKLLAPGSRIPARLDPLSDLKASLPDVVGRVEGTLLLLNRLLVSADAVLGEENQQHVTSILRNLDRAAETLPPQIAGMLDSVDERLRSLADVFASARDAIDRLAQTAGKAGDLLEQSELQTTLVAAREAIARLSEVEAGAVSLLREGSRLLAGVREPLQTTLRSTRESMRELRGFARTLRLAPTSLINGAERSELQVPATPGGGSR